MIDDYLIGTPPRRYWHILPGFSVKESARTTPPPFYSLARKFS